MFLRSKFPFKGGYLLLSSLLFLSACLGAADVRYTGAPEYTELSGVESENLSWISSSQVEEEDGSTPGDYALVGLEWFEGQNISINNQPCDMIAKFRKLDDILNVGQETYGEAGFEVCYGGSSEGSSKSVSVSPLLKERNELRYVGDPLLLFVNEIQTCNSRNDDNDRIKGIRVGGAFATGVEPRESNYSCTSVNGEPTEGDLETCTEEAVRMSEATRANCGTWNEAQKCPRGMIASGIRVSHDGLYGDHGIVGLSLQCSTVYIRDDSELPQ